MNELRQRLARYLQVEPVVGRGVYRAPSAIVVGRVTVGEFSSIWHNAVLRADVNQITVGRCSNIQDNCVVHLADDFECVIGKYVTMGHGAILHGCRVEDEVLIGMGATVLEGAVIGSQSVVGARAVVTGSMRVPPGSLVLGMPARVVRPLSPEERARLKSHAKKYVAIAAVCRQGGH